MLLVHPSSQCDVCLDPYTWATPAKSPHAIQCGHVFCLDCLRSVSPSNCPLCRKGFNPERIKKLHVDKVNGDGSGAAGPVAQENELFRRIAMLFSESASPEDINTLREEVNAWVIQCPRPSADLSVPHPLSSAVSGLLSYLELQREKAQTKREMERLRLTHERHVAVKNKDSQVSALVERNLLQAKTQVENEAAALRAEIERLQEELRRYTHPTNPLPRPPEVNPIVSNLIRQSANLPSAPLAPGAPGTVAAAPESGPSQDRAGAGRPTSLRFVEPAAPERERSKYRITSTGEQLRQENRRRQHLIIPGAHPSARIFPEDIDATPRASTAGPVRPLGMWAGDDWTYDYPDPRPRLGEPAVWAGLPEAVPPGIPNLTVYKPPTPPAAGATSAPLVAGAGNSQPSASNAGPSSLGGQPSVSDGQQPALNGQVAADLPEVTIPGEPYVTRSMRMPVDTAAPAISGRSPHRWRPGPAHKPGYVLAYVPQHGPCWIHESKAAKLPVRAWGTESRYAYVIAKEPSQIDEEWRQTHDGASPGPNPLQLSGVPEDVVAGPSRTIIRQEDEDDNGAHATARENSTLFTNLPETATRPAIGISIGSMAEPSDSSRAGPSGVRSPVGRNSSDVLTTQPEPGRSTTARPAVRGQVPNETLPAPSPASSWGPSNFQPSRRSSLSLQLNNFPPPSNVPQPTGSMEQLGLTNFGDAPLTLDIVIRTEPSSDRQVSELGLSSGAEGSSRQVVTGLQDLEDINRSLMQVTESSSQRDARNARSSTSSRHSRHSSLSSHESGAIIGPRTGLALYGSRSATRNSGSHPSTDPSSANLCALAQAGSPSRTSARSHAESTRSRKSSASSTGLQRSVSERPPRTSALASTSFPEPLALRQSSWTAEPADTHPYAPGGPNTASRPQASQESIPRSLDAIDGFGGTSGSLMLSFEAPSTSAAVDRNGEAATGIHAPRPVSSRHSSLFRVTWNASQ